MRLALPAALAILQLSSTAAISTPRYESRAPVAYMIDLASGRVLHDTNGARRMLPASMAKMMTTHVAFTLIRQGRLRLDQKFRMRPETWAKWHGQGSTMFIAANEEVSVENLLRGIITLSGNDACVVLAEGIAGSEAAFTRLMNAEAKRLGLASSHFATSNGWPDGGSTYVTARDLAELARSTIEETPDLYRSFYASPAFSWGRSGAGGAITQGNRNPILGRIAGADGLKTGHTNEAGFGFTGSAIQNGRRLIMVVAGLPSMADRASESVKFMDWGFRAWKTRPLARAGTKLGTARVQGSWTRSVDLVAPRDLAASVDQLDDGELRAKIVYDGPLKAPIRKGQLVAQLVVTSAGGDSQSLPLAAAQEVPDDGVLGRIWSGLTSLFN